MGDRVHTTQLLHEVRQGSKRSVDLLFPRILGELKQIAHLLLLRRPAGGVLDTTGLVHEAYLKLIDQTSVEWTDRAHFQALAARAMRHILVNHFHRQRAQKRGGSLHKVAFDEGKIPIGERGDVLLALDEALEKLTRIDQRKAQVVMYRFYGGMTQRAIANVLDVSPRTVRRDWRTAKAWLSKHLTEQEHE